VDGAVRCEQLVAVALYNPHPGTCHKRHSSSRKHAVDLFVIPILRTSGSPAERGMLVVQLLDLLVALSGQCSVYVDGCPSLVVPLHPQEKQA
jgi:hypothetical protein